MNYKSDSKADLPALTGKASDSASGGEGGLSAAVASFYAARFDSTGLKPREQLDVFDRFADGRYRLSSPYDSRLDAFKVKFTDIRLGEFCLGHAASVGGFDFTRDAGIICGDPRDEMSLGYRIRGRTVVESKGVQRVWSPGELIVVDMTNPMRYREITSTGEHIRFRIPRCVAASLMGNRMGVHNAFFQGALPALLGDHLRSLVRNVHKIRDGNLDEVLGVTRSLLTATLSPSRDNLVYASGAIEAALLERASKYIDENLLSKTLSPDAVALAIGVSRRKLYQIFEGLGGVSKEIMARRLSRAHAVLSAPGAFRRIKEVAFAHGFESEAHFSRCFKQRFGYPPSEAVERSLGLPRAR